MTVLVSRLRALKDAGRGRFCGRKTDTEGVAMTDDERKAQAFADAFARFEEAWGNEYDAEDSQDVWCLNALVEQELAAMHRDPGAEQQADGAGR